MRLWSFCLMSDREPACWAKPWSHFQPHQATVANQSLNRGSRSQSNSLKAVTNKANLCSMASTYATKDKKEKHVPDLSLSPQPTQWLSREDQQQCCPKSLPDSESTEISFAAVSGQPRPWLVLKPRKKCKPPSVMHCMHCDPQFYECSQASPASFWFVEQRLRFEILDRHTSAKQSWRKTQN